MVQANKQFVIWGSGGTAKKLFDVVTLNGDRVVALFDRNPQAKSALNGVPIFYGEEGLKTWVESGACEMPCNALVGAASAHGSDRIAILNLFSKYSFLTPSVFHITASLSPTAQISRGCEVFAQAIVDAHAVVGEACIINDAARVGHDCIIGAAVHVAPGAMILGGSRIGDNVLVGANAVIMPGVEVGANAKVGAGTVVLSSLPANVVAVGNPARVIKGDQRETSHTSN
jgi:sugar O-acyltransferase (sialic acid O-acetyltransferase NeuD family)